MHDNVKKVKPMATEVIDHGEEHIYDVFLNDQVVKLPLFYILFFVCVVF